MSTCRGMVGIWSMIGVVALLVAMGPTVRGSDTIIVKSARLASPTCHMACSRSMATGKIYCLGGLDISNVPVARIDEYDPVQDVLVTKLAVLPSARREVAGAASPITGKVYCFGGNYGGGYWHDLDEIIEYDPVADVCVTKTARLPSIRNSVACAADPATGRIYILGGLCGPAGGEKDEILEYDPAADAIVTKSARLPTPRCSGGCACSSTTGRVYYVGGFHNYTFIDEIVEYDPATDVAVTKTARLPSGRTGVTCAADSATGKIYCFGGADAVLIFDDVIEYDPLEDRISIMDAKLPQPTWAMGGASDSVTRKIYCLGGYTASVHQLDEILEYMPPGPPPCEVARLTASDGAVGDLFSYDISADGDWLIAGANQDDNENGVDAGAAYVFRRHGVEWVEEAKLTAWDGCAGDHFGQALVITGDRIAIGAPQHGWGGNGAVYTFRLAGSTWVPEAKLVASDGHANDIFGLFLALQGERMAISASHHTHTVSQEGAVYVFEFDGTNWIETAELRAADAYPGLEFGSTVAMDGARIAAGANDIGHSFTGAAYVFHYDGSNWVQEAKLTAQEPTVEDYFYHVAIAGDVVCVGADQRWGAGTGFVDVFRHDGASYVRAAHLTPSDGIPRDAFAVVSLFGNRLAVGAGQGQSSGRGAVYLFDCRGGAWAEVAKLTASDGTDQDEFGTTLSLQEEFIAIGALQHFNNGPGKAYVFALDGDDCNQNGVLDWCDIAAGTSQDTNGDGVPDECGSQLTLEPDQTCYQIGDEVTVEVWMRDVAEDIVGGQFLLQYEPELVLGSVLHAGAAAITPGDPPLTRQIHECSTQEQTNPQCTPEEGLIEYSVGVADFNDSATGSHRLAVLHFTATAEICNAEALLSFRPAAPFETRLTASSGTPHYLDELMDLPAISLDSTPPVVTPPPDITVNADAGWCAAIVDPGVATGVDNCGGPVTIVGTRSDAQSLSNPYPAGTITITWMGIDECGNVGSAEQFITVLPYNDVNITLELQGPLQNTVVRCFKFVFFDCAHHEPPAELHMNVTFPANPAGNSVASILLTDLPCSPTGYDCVVGEDELHTLTVQAAPMIAGTQYMVECTASESMFFQADLYNDNLVDIVDFGVFVSEWGWSGDPNTPCGVSFPCADMDASGYLDMEDYAFIEANYLMVGDADCCGAPLPAAPRTWITVNELLALGLPNLALADLTGDDVVDALDMQAFAEGERPDFRMPRSMPENVQRQKADGVK